MNRPLKVLARNAPQRSRQRPLPSWIPPMLATLSEVFPTEGKWVYEPKLDGVRALIYASEGAARVYSRNRKPLNDAYPELVEALGPAVRGDTVLDGEIVAFDPERGVTSFSRLQQRMQLRDPVRARRSQVAVYLYLFDCLYYEGVDLTGLPLLDRKAVLRDVVWYDDPIRFTPYKTSGGVAMLRAACEEGAEGIIAKRATSRYVSTRSTDWLKIKCLRRQEFVIGGYTAPQGSRERLGALMVGYYDGRALRYAGKVGTGYDRRTLEDLHRRLVPLHRPTSPFSEGPTPAGEIQWVEPKLVGEVGFSEWTSAGLLRHPRFLGLRSDKPARQVRRED
ncbi:MAG TPA: non-homologous end-joining DNA ligase [Gemmatimonadales bacterium]|jgi:bifunctional non-homologous end joining protein LigD|nr:non-homologous end-joining DNA ligase [Gemmatimonadales bacterium]